MSAAGIDTSPPLADPPPGSSSEAADPLADRVPGSLGEAAAMLADGAVAALPSWVERCVADACERAGISAADLSGAARTAGLQCVAETGPLLWDLLATDVDEQQTTPLSVLRGAVRFPTQVLADGGVPAPDRDDFDASRFPDDPYGLTPASFADIDPELGPIGIVWGAAKAFEVLQRRRTAEPARRDDTAEPARRDDTAEPARRDDTAEPARRDDTAEPARRSDTEGRR